MKVGVIFKEEDKLIASTAKKVIEELKGQGHSITEKDPKFVMTFGGDGTILRAARLVSEKGIPLLGVHMGGVGLLTEIDLSEIPDSLELIKKGGFKLDERMMLDCKVVRKGKVVLDGFALNDIVIGKSNIARTVKLEAFDGKRSIAEFVGDGLVISTPTGSTAYNFAVSGPILSPNSKSFILSPICPHRAANRSIILEDPVTIKILKGEDILLTIDGQKIFKLEHQDSIVVEKAKRTTKFIRLKDYDIWSLLRSKLGWG